MGLEWICGGYCVHSPSLKRFFSFHFHFSKRFLWSHSNSLSLFSSNSFRDLFSLTSRQCIRSLCITYSLHIVPEWYFLCQYAMLKAVPNKNAGFIILLSSIFILFIFAEITSLTTLCH